MWRGAGRLAGVVLALAALLASGRDVRANGGVIRVARELAGPYRLTATTSPSPPRVGSLDVSVLVERANADDLVRDARVTVTIEPRGHRGQGGSFEATRERATDKQYYAADVQLPSAGRWQIAVRVAGQLGEGTVVFEVDTEQEAALDRPLLLALLLTLPLLPFLVWRARALRRREGARDDRAD